MDAYLRPCAANPDGLEFDSKYVRKLLALDLIESAYPWAENSSRLDYYPIYNDDNMDVVMNRIERIVGA